MAAFTAFDAVPRSLLYIFATSVTYRLGPLRLICAAAGALFIVATSSKTGLKLPFFKGIERNISSLAMISSGI
ncbi:hypothetical protein D3C79_1060330 [compost metagenome]